MLQKKITSGCVLAGMALSLGLGFSLGGGGCGDDSSNPTTDAHVDGDVSPPDGQPEDGQTDEDGAQSGDNAVFVSQDVLSSIQAGASFEAQFTMQNTGTTTWTRDALYRLGSQTPQGNQTWGRGRIPIEESIEVAPGAQYTFVAQLTAPATPMLYNMQWQMVHEQVGWFGEPTPLVEIEVTDSCADHCTNGLMDLACGEIYIDCGGQCPSCEPIELAVAAQKGGYPKVAVTSPYKVMTVWARSQSDNDNHLRWRCFDGESWTSADRVTPGNGRHEYPWIVTDSQHRFHLTHNKGFGDTRVVHYNRYDAADCGGSWHNPGEELERAVPYSAAYPAITVDENDAAYITYSQSLAPRQNPFPDCGPNGECAANEHCYTLANICIPDYTQHVVHRTGGAFGDGTWTAFVDLTGSISGVQFSHHGTIDALSSTSVHVVWMHGDPNRQIYYAKFDGTSWSEAEYTGINAHIADVQVDPQTVHIFSNNARYNTRPVGTGSWATPVTLSNDHHINFIKLILDADGRLHAVWPSALENSNDTNEVLYTMTDANGDWRSIKVVSPPGVRVHEPSLAVDEDGNAHFIWAQKPIGSEGEFGSVWYLKSRYEELADF
jgi:hypothetical protein